MNLESIIATGAEGEEPHSFTLWFDEGDSRFSYLAGFWAYLDKAFGQEVDSKIDPDSKDNVIRFAVGNMLLPITYQAVGHSGAIVAVGDANDQISALSRTLVKTYVDRVAAEEGIDISYVRDVTRASK